jgi:hypothetical protein
MSAGRWARPVALVGAAAFVFAAVWSALVGFEVVVSGPPEGAGADLEAEMRAYWAWYAGTVPARQATSFTLLIALAALAVVSAGLAAARPGRVAATAAGVVVAGALFWAIAACVRLGTDKAIALLATHENPIEPTNSIAFTASWLATGFESVGSLLAGAGVVALATGAALAALGVCLYLPVGDLQPWVQLAAGAVLLPCWLVATATQSDMSMQMSINSIVD